MNRNRNTNPSYIFGLENQKSFFQFLKNVLTVNGISPFDIFQLSNEKLPIVYANIRV